MTAIGAAIGFYKVKKFFDRLGLILNDVVVAIITDAAFIIFDKWECLRKKTIGASTKGLNSIDIEL